MVLIFSIPSVVQTPSNSENRLFNRSTTSLAESFSESGVKPTISANMILTLGLVRAITPSPSRRIFARSRGMILCSRRSDLIRSSTRKYEYIAIGNPSKNREPVIFDIAIIWTTHRSTATRGCIAGTVKNMII